MEKPELSTLMTMKVEGRGLDQDYDPNAEGLKREWLSRKVWLWYSTSQKFNHTYSVYTVFHIVSNSETI